MSNYTIEELIARWKREELTVEQMIGQMLLVLKEQERRLRAVSKEQQAGQAAGSISPPGRQPGRDG